jgi:hypothetical protein
VKNPNYNPLISDAQRESRKNKIPRTLFDQSGKNNPMFGRKHSDETKLKISNRRHAATRIVCQCGTLVDKANYARWHGDNCKWRTHCLIAIQEGIKKTEVELKYDE